MRGKKTQDICNTFKNNDKFKNLLLWNWAFEDIKRKNYNILDYVAGSVLNPGGKNWGFSTGS